MEKDSLVKVADQFFRDFPNGTKMDFSKYVRQREREELEAKFQQEKNKVLNNLNRGLYHQ